MNRLPNSIRLGTTTINEMSARAIVPMIPRTTPPVRAEPIIVNAIKLNTGISVPISMLSVDLLARDSLHQHDWLSLAPFAMATLSRPADLQPPKMLRDGRMADMGKPHRGDRPRTERQVGAGRAMRPGHASHATRCVAS
ncbi:hypothetical protein J4E08_23760 [Sagittula sp. NFXS13]|uniref:hypothetical protein n=1 Tax=Sagittula sp. NFXS13 TaxID=2819095 RepID=UPI0032E00CC6